MELALVKSQNIDLGVYVNADEIKVALDNQIYIDFSLYQLRPDIDDLINALSNSTIINNDISFIIIANLRISESFLYVEKMDYNYIFSTFLADYFREKLLGNCYKFTFETVMSHPSKLDFIKKAKSEGYKVYLYFVSLENPIINIQRVEARVLQGGHNVPTIKISDRYYRTMGFLLEALKLVDRAFLFDNSSVRPVLFATYENEEILINNIDRTPQWFYNYVINRV